jgi:hypothetical protein
MIEEPMSHTDHEFHRKIAAECFNRTWNYLKQKNRNPDDDQTMLNLAHASRYHWSIIGKPLNFAIGDWADLAGVLGPEPAGPSHTFRKDLSPNVPEE